MIILIHGDDIESSRKILTDYKNKYSDAEIIVFDGSKLLLSDLVLACEASSLFQLSKVIVIENILVGGVTSQKVSLFDYLTNKEIQYPVFIWESRQIDKLILKKYFSSVKIYECQFPALMFRFLDSIGKISTKMIIEAFHQLLSQKDVEVIFAMLIRQWRLLIIAADIGMQGFPDMPSWQANKFISQACVFKKEDLIKSYRQLLLIDYQRKKGQTPYTLIKLLDIFFTTL